MSFTPPSRLSLAWLVPIITIALILTSTQASAQTHKLVKNDTINSSFVKRYKNMTYTDMKKTNDDQFIYAGSIFDPVVGVFNPGIRKIDQKGNITLQATYGNSTFPGLTLLPFSAVDSTDDGGYVVVGTSIFNEAFDQRAYIAKLDHLGNIQWQRLFSQSNLSLQTRYEYTGVTQARDGTYVALGNIFNSTDATNVGNFLVRFDANGNLLSSKHYPLPGEATTLDYISSTRDGGQIVIGTNRLKVNSIITISSIVVLKLNSSGSISWARLFTSNTTNDRFFVPQQISQTSRGGYITTGYIQDNGTTPSAEASRDGFVLKLNSTGSKAWYATLDNGNFDQLNAIVQAKDQSFLAVGSFGDAGSNPETENLWMIQLSPKKGSIIKAKSYSQGLIEAGSTVLDTLDQGYLITGVANSTSGVGITDLVLKVDKDLKLLQCDSVSNIATTIKDTDLSNGVTLSGNELPDIAGQVEIAERVRIDLPVQLIDECPI